LTVIFPEEAMAVLETLIFVSSKPVTAATLSRITVMLKRMWKCSSTDWQNSMNSQGMG